MGKLIFYYGVMGCSKSANALMTRFQYIERGMRVWLIKPAIDTRDDTAEETIIKSRVGIEAVAYTITTDMNIMSEAWNANNFSLPDVIICDEAQFLTAEQVEQLRKISSSFNTQVLCYGLRTDFQSKMFEGSKRLFELADNFIELESICDCGKHAIINARLNEKGQIITEGSQVLLGGNDKYKPLCWECWKSKMVSHGVILKKNKRLTTVVPNDENLK